MVRIFRRVREWGVRTPGLFGNVEWIGEGAAAKAEAEKLCAQDRRLRLVQRHVKRRDRCSGGKCTEGFLCRKHFGQRAGDAEFQLYDDKGRNLNTKRWDED